MNSRRSAPTSILAQVQCYSVDSSGRGFYSELQEYNFDAELELKTALKISITECAHPGLRLDDPSVSFKCYSANFLGEHLDLRQRPLQVKYIKDSLEEDKSIVLYLCKEAQQFSGVMENRRDQLIAVTARPSMLAQDFLRSTCGSFTELEYISGTPGGALSRRVSFSVTEVSGDANSLSRDWKPQPTHQMKVYPHRTSPLRHASPSKPHHTALSKSVSVAHINTSPPSMQFSQTSTTLPSRGPLYYNGGLGVPHVQRCSKSPVPFFTEYKKKGQIITLDHRLLAMRKEKMKPRPTSVASVGLPPDHTISSPVHKSSDQAPSADIALRRANAIRRTSLHDLGVNDLFYNLSTNPIPVTCLFTDQNHDLSQEETVTLHISVFNYMTVGELKSYIYDEIEKQTAVRILPSSSLTLYYSHDGEDYELLVETQFMFHTFFHELLAKASTSPTETMAPLLHARLGNNRLPEKELRVLYRISQLTGVLLEDDVSLLGMDTSNLTLLPKCDQEEVQYARRCLHSYIKKVVAKREEQAYSSCRDIASRDASMQLSLMTPTDNTLPITFHYKTDFSLRRHLSIHTFANKALSGLFPCLVASGLVRNKIEDYTLQVTGEESYIFGEIELIAFRHIRKCIVKSEPIHLSVAEKPPIEVERPHQFSLLSVDPLSNRAMNHHELSNLSPICQEGVCSVWDIKNKLRMIRLRIEGLPRLYRRGIQVCMELRLLHGCKNLCHSVATSSKVEAYTLMWNECLEFDIEIRDIPRAARIFVMLMESRSTKHSSHGESMQLLFWGMISVFEPSGRLRAGHAELRLWKGEENKRAGDSVVTPNLATHPANNPHLNAVKLHITFQRVTTGPIIYPSTRGESRSIFMKQHTAIPNVQARKQFRTMLETIRREKLYKALPDYVLMSRRLPGMLELFHALDELQESIKDVPDHVALRLLDSDFPDEHVRAFAVKALKDLPDEQLEDYLLQLVQALKFEAKHDSALARFLLRKALTNKTIGHFFFWYLKSEMHSRLHTTRFAVILEAYLKGCGELLLTKFTDQVDIQNSLCDMALKLRGECENGADLEKMQALLPHYLHELDSPRFLFIPVHNPRHVLGKLNPQKCKVMSSKKRPMWLEMYNIHQSALRQSPNRLILKLGDDLRQDMITLRMFSLFEKLWEEQGLDLELIPYGCMATGPNIGFIEVVKNAKTIKEVSSVTNSTKLFEWIKSHQKNEFGETDYEMLDAAVKLFTRSCAGYSVATYVLGIGDRHNDNIMVTTSGNLFHIDFGHFLGHIKYFMGFKREWAPFVLTPDFVHVMGGENSETFETYKNLCCRAFLTLRRNADLIINLFSLMRSTGIPELTCVEDTNYIRNVLEIELAASENVAEMRFRKVIQKCLNLKWTVQIMWRLHIAKHGSE